MSPLCNLCGLREAGSREHLPGVAATNDAAVEVTYIGQHPDTAGHIQWVRRVEDDGFVVRTLCRHCNSRTGGNYGTAYKAFVQQFGRSGVFEATARRCWISLQDVQPLRITKQMVSMFLAAQPETNPANWGALRRFVLNRDTRLDAGALHIYVYRNVAPIGRVIPFTGVMSYSRRWPQMLMSEIAWPPLGIVFTTEPHPLVASMYEITHWGRDFHFRSRDSFGFSVPQLAVASHWPLGFGSEREAHAWANRDGVMLLLHRGSGNDSEPRLPAVTRALRRGTSNER